jgi:hypothetical protein
MTELTPTILPTISKLSRLNGIFVVKSRVTNPGVVSCPSV